MNIELLRAVMLPIFQEAVLSTAISYDDESDDESEGDAMSARFVAQALAKGLIT